MTKSKFLALADRCEAATGPDRELFEDAFRECFPKPQRVWVTDSSGPWTDEYSEWQQRQARFYELLDAGAFLDAAMTLVPEGWQVSELGEFCGWKAILAERPSEAQRRAYDSGKTYAVESERGEAPTPALALCAAALRARAAQCEEETHERQ